LGNPKEAIGSILKKDKDGKRDIIGNVKEAFGIGGNKTNCISICDDSLKKLAALLKSGGGGFGGLGGDDGLDLEDTLDFGGGGKGRSKRRKGKGNRSRGRNRRRNRGRGRGKGIAAIASAGAGLLGMAGVGGEESGALGGTSAALEAVQDVGDAADTVKDIGGLAKGAAKGPGLFGKIQKGIGGFGSKIGDFFGKMGKSTIMSKLGGFITKIPIGKLLGFIGPILEAVSIIGGAKDIFQELREGKISRKDAEDKAGGFLFGKLGSILGGVGGAALSGLFGPLAPVAGPLLSMAGASAGEWLAELIGNNFKGAKASTGAWLIDTFMDKDKNPVTADKTAIKEKEAQSAKFLGTPVKDAAVYPDGRVIKTGAGELLRPDANDTIFAVQKGPGQQTSSGGSNELVQAVTALVKAMKESKKEIVLNVDGKVLQRIAFSEFTPRAT
jgi:hypothetical protein